MSDLNKLERAALNIYNFSEYEDPKQDPLYEDLKKICESDREGPIDLDYFKHCDDELGMKWCLFGCVPLIILLFVNWSMTLANRIFIIVMFAISIGVFMHSYNNIGDWLKDCFVYKFKTKYGLSALLITVFGIVICFTKIDVGIKKILLLASMYCISAIFMPLILKYEKAFDIFISKAEEKLKYKNQQFEKTVNSLRIREEVFSNDFCEISGEKDIAKRYYWWDLDPKIIDCIDISKPVTRKYSNENTYDTYDNSFQATKRNVTTTNYFYAKTFDFEVPINVGLLKDNTNNKIIRYINHNNFISFDDLGLKENEDADTYKTIVIGVNWRERTKKLIETQEYFSPTETEVANFSLEVNGEKDFWERVTNKNGLTDKEMYYASLFADIDAAERVEIAEQAAASEIMRNNKVDKFIKNNSGVESKGKHYNYHKEGKEYVAFIVNGRLFFKPSDRMSLEHIVAHVIKAAPEIVETVKKTPFRGYKDPFCAEIASMIVHKKDFWE